MTDVSNKKVMVSGCFDMLHSGHIAFLQSAASYGKLFVCIGSDQTVFNLKNRKTVNPETERKYMIEALSCVYKVYVSSGSGYLDFLPEMEIIQPDVFVVNHDGHSLDKEALCHSKGIEYIVLPRIPQQGLLERSTTALRQVNHIPYRIDLAGGWLDQPFVSKFAHGPVLTLCLEPNNAFDTRSGMATSTRKCAIELWHHHIPRPNDEITAKQLFAYENPPGTQEIAGSQDSIGIVYTGLSKLFYNGKYWPSIIDNIQTESIFYLLEEHLYFIPLGPRKDGYQVLADTDINVTKAQALAMAAQSCWDAILKADLFAIGKGMTASFKAQINMFPRMVDEEIMQQINTYKDKVLGYKISGAGGGGYLVLLSNTPIENAIKVKIRRMPLW
jgi:cytidyltransferase-like protein